MRKYGSEINMDVLRVIDDLLRSEQAACLPYEKKVLAKIQVLIEKHYKEHRGLPFYASSLGLSIKEINKILRFHKNLTLADMIRDRLHQEAVKLLLETCRLSIKNIAYELGYSEPAYFNRIFKKNSGVTPKHFRNTARGIELNDKNGDTISAPISITDLRGYLVPDKVMLDQQLPK